MSAKDKIADNAEIIMAILAAIGIVIVLALIYVLRRGGNDAKEKDQVVQAEGSQRLQQGQNDQGQRESPNAQDSPGPKKEDQAVDSPGERDQGSPDRAQGAPGGGTVKPETQKEDVKGENTQVPPPGGKKEDTKDKAEGLAT